MYDEFYTSASVVMSYVRTFQVATGVAKWGVTA